MIVCAAGKMGGQTVTPAFEYKAASYEYHWYEHYGIGRFETTLKVVS